MSAHTQPVWSRNVEPLPLSRDEFHHLMQTRRRRFMTRYLAGLEPGTEIEVSRLSEIVASDEYDCPRSHLNSTQRKRLYTTIKQNHVPALEEAGVAEHERGTLVPGPNARPLAAALRALDGFFEE